MLFNRGHGSESTSSDPDSPSIDIPNFRLKADSILISGNTATLNATPLGDAVNGTAMVHTLQGVEEHSVDLVFLAGRYVARFSDSNLDGLSATVTYLIK